MILRVARKNLLRNRWRSALTLGGIAVSVSLLVWTLAYLGGFHDAMVDGATSLNVGQIQIHNQQYAEKPQPRHHFAQNQKQLRDLAENPEIAGVSPRVYFYGLVGNEDKSVVAQLVGIDPSAEAATTTLKDGLVEGAWLDSPPPAYPSPRPSLVGVSLARQLDVKLGDELVIFFESADGSLGNEVLQITGLLETGNSSVDRRSVYLHLSDLQYAGAMEQKLHEVSIRLTRPESFQEVAATIREEIADETLRVRTWKELMPEMFQILEVTKQSDVFLFMIIYLIMAFGLLNTQRMSALERRREFGVLIAIGVTPRRLFLVVMVETLLITLLGAILGAALGWLFSLYFVHYGLDLTLFGEMDGFQFMGVSFSNRLFFSLTPTTIAKPILYIVPFAILCGLWPAWQASKTHITNAIAGRSL